MDRKAKINSLLTCYATELSLEQQFTIEGGGFASNLGYAFGFASGYFFAAGDKIALEAIAIVRFGFLR